MSGTKSLHTLNARDHVMLEVMRDHFRLSADHMFREIQGLRRAAEEALAQKGIGYDKLRSALVPDQHRREIALVFDSMTIKSSWYGLDVFKRVSRLRRFQTPFSRIGPTWTPWLGSFRRHA